MTNIVVHVATLTDGKEQINYDDPSVSMRQPWSILFKTVGAASLELWIILVTVVKHKVWIFELQSGQHVQMAGDDSEKINETKKETPVLPADFGVNLSLLAAHTAKSR